MSRLQLQSQKGKIRNMYRVACPHCGEEFATSTANWCRCLNKERSLTCLFCRRCFCDASAEFLTQFWRDAPADLWDVRREMRTADEQLSPVLRKPLVLVVDDDPGIRTLAMELISRFGYGCMTASRGDSALRLARRYHPDLVLTDLLMPGLDGRELSHALKNDDEIPAPRVIVMTSVYRGEDYQGEAREQYGVDDYLEKPVPIDVLRSRLAELLPPPERSQARLDPTSGEFSEEDLEGLDDLDDEAVTIM